MPIEPDFNSKIVNCNFLFQITYFIKTNYEIILIFLHVKELTVCNFDILKFLIYIFDWRLL